LGSLAGFLKIDCYLQKTAIAVAINPNPPPISAAAIPALALTWAEALDSLREEYWIPDDDDEDYRYGGGTRSEYAGERSVFDDVDQ